MSWREQSFTLPADHPSAAGHFPGTPIIPGALLLDALVAAMDMAPPIAIRAVKFLRPVPHGTALRLRWQPKAGAYTFECRTAADDLVMTGSLAHD